MLSLGLSGPILRVCLTCNDQLNRATAVRRDVNQPLRIVQEHVSALVRCKSSSEAER
jgi:hypothetical protein